MSTAARERRAGGPAPIALRCGQCDAVAGAMALNACAECMAPLEPAYDRLRRLPDRAEIGARPRNLWRYREWLPFEGRPAVAVDAGWTPLIESPRLASWLGVARCWIKNDAASSQSLSFKDRVVATALNAAHAFRLPAVACASTGNLGNALASAAARHGIPAWVFIPHDLEPAKVAASAVHGARVVRVRGTYDDVNRLCAQLADRLGWGVVNVNLRPYYGEGSKTMAFEIAEQLGWRLPDAIVAPMAGGSLVGRLRQGMADLLDAELVAGIAPRLYGAQADGCAPIVRLVERGDDVLVPERPRTIARSLAIGAPADGLGAARAIRQSGGWARAVSDEALVAGIRALAEGAGIFAETAGGVTVAAARSLVTSGHLGVDDEVVLCITGHGLKTVDALDDPPVPLPVVNPKFAEIMALAHA